MIEHHRRTIAYDRWANAAALGALRALEHGPDGIPERALAILSHVAAAEELWLDRLAAADRAVVVWPDRSLVETAAAFAILDDRWERFFDTLPPERLFETIGYVNSRGEQWRSTVDDVLSHVALHGSYHRGQIATLLRAAGHPPAYTDFIHAARSGLLA